MLTILVLLLLHISSSITFKVNLKSKRLVNKMSVITSNSNGLSEKDVLNFEYNPISAEDQALHELFMTELSEQIYAKPSRESYLMKPKKIIDYDKKMESRDLVETPTTLTEGLPLEIIYKKKLVFGNFVSYKDDSHTIYVRLQSDEVVLIDVGQVISVWDQLADETPPSSQDEWAEVVTEAFTLLGNMSPRKSDLEEFWTSVSQRRTELAIDSQDLGIYIFQEYCYRRWLDPYSGGGEVRALSAAQRYAAAILLFFDDIHFKRRPSVHILGLKKRGSVVEGGYKPLDEGVVMFKQGDAFIQSYTTKIETTVSSDSDKTKVPAPSSSSSSSKSNPYYSTYISRIQRAIETYAVSPSKMSPPPLVKHVLKRLQFESNPSGARSLLMKISHHHGVSNTSLKHSKSTNANSSNNEKSVSDIPSNSNYVQITPWSDQVMESVGKLSTYAKQRQQELTNAPIGKAGKIGSHGRMDFRGSTETHPVICLDSKKASFFDDGFSLSPDTGEILIHISDVSETIRRYPALMDTAKDRVASVFTPQGPLHMLPPQALDELRLSPNRPNEVITVGLSVDFNTGKLIGCRIFPSVIGPVVTMDTEFADDLFAQVEDGKKSIPRPPGYTQTQIKDLIVMYQLMKRVIRAQPWSDATYSTASGGGGRETVLDRRTGTYSYGSASRTPCSRMVNALLTLYSNSTATYCEQQNVPIPIAWENRDRIDSNLVRRFATQPLRNWLAMMQQLQVRASIRLNAPLTKSDCALAVSHVNAYRKKQAPMKQMSRHQTDFEAFLTHCQAIKLSTGQDDVILVGEVVGQGGKVRLKEFNIQGVVLDDSTMNSYKRGDNVRVRVRKIQQDSKSIILDVI